MLSNIAYEIIMLGWARVKLARFHRTSCCAHHVKLTTDVAPPTVFCAGPTTPTPAPTTSPDPSTSTYIIIGVSIAILALVVVFVMCCCDCMAICGRHKSRKHQVTPTPHETEDGFEIVQRAPSRDETRCVIDNILKMIP